MVWCKSRLSFCRSFLEEKNVYALAAWEGNNAFLQRCFPRYKGEGHLGILPPGTFKLFVPKDILTCSLLQGQ